jgi:hypothetical protein
MQIRIRIRNTDCNIGTVPYLPCVKAGECAGRCGQQRRLSERRGAGRRRCCQRHIPQVTNILHYTSVADPDPSDPYVFGPPGSGSIRQRYGSGSGSFYH